MIAAEYRMVSCCTWCRRVAVLGCIRENRRSVIVTWSHTEKGL